jgi:hypothetical protein
MEHWNGTYWDVSPLEPRNTAGSDLADVSCVSPADCWAVGDTLGEQVGHFDHWNGASWMTVAEPSLPGQETQMETVQCLSADACWAVGISRSVNAASSTLAAAVWNGQAWTQEPVVMPPPASVVSGGGPGALIARIACVSPSFCIGAGSRPQPNGEYANTLIEELS